MKQMPSTKTLLIKDSFGICYGICHREKFSMTCTGTLHGHSFGIFLQNIFGLYITVKIIILETCLMII